MNAGSHERRGRTFSAPGRRTRRSSRVPRARTHVGTTLGVAQPELFSPDWMAQLVEFCGWALARAHARSGEPAQISGYLGKSDAFDDAIAAFAVAYADQTERDHATFKKAVRSGRVEVDMEDDRG